MSCPDYESRIVEWLDGALGPGEAALVETHVGGCRACSAFVTKLRELDAALAHELTAPVLPGDFASKILTRIDRETPAEEEARRTELKRQMQAEYEVTLTRMQRHFRSFASVLDALGLGLLTAGALTAAVLQAPKLIPALPTNLQSTFGTPVMLGAVLATILVLAGAWLVSRRPSRLTCVM